MSDIGAIGEKIGYDDRFSLFNLPMVDAATQAETTVDFRPTTAFKRGQTLDIVVNPTSLYYIDLSRSTLQVTFNILRSDGKPVTKADKVTTSNCPAACLFRQVDISLSQQLLSADINCNFAHKFYIDTILNRTASYLETVGQSFMFYKDTAYKFNDTDVSEKGVNAGLLARYQRTKEGKMVTVEAPICCDLSELQQYILPGVELRLKLYPSLDSFGLMSSSLTEQYSINIDSVTFRCRFVEPTPALTLLHSKTLEAQPALYNYTRSVLKSFTIPKGQRRWSLDSLYSDELPYEIIVVFVDSEGYNGSFTENPFKYQHFGLEYLAFHIEGSNPLTYQPDFDTGQYTSEYTQLFENNFAGGIVSYEEYAGGYTVFKLSLSAGVRRSFNSALKKSQTRLILRFNEDLKQNVTCITYGRYHSSFKIDIAKNCYLL